MEESGSGDPAVSLKRLIRARVRLMAQQPFFGRLAMMLALEPSNQIDTVGTDGEGLFFNATYIATLSEEELLGIVLHEVMHCSLGSLWRRGNREHHRWNYASDYVINDILVQSNFKIPKGGLLSDKFHNQTAEWVYDQLQVTYISLCPQCNGKGDKDGKGQCSVCGSHSHWDDKKNQKNEDGRSAGEQIRKMWEGAMADALKESQQRGDTPAGFERLIAELESKEDWKRVLASYLSTSSTDFDFLTRDRRFLDAEFYLPGLQDETQLEDLVVVVDTSGSIDTKMLNRFISETKGIVKQFSRVKGWLVDCDCAIGKWTDLDEGLKRKSFGGGGGTSHKPVFKEIEKRGIKPKAMLAFTDLYTEFPDKSPDYPVLWVVPGKYASSENPPFGRVIRLKGEF